MIAVIKSLRIGASIPWLNITVNSNFLKNRETSVETSHIEYRIIFIKFYTLKF